MNPIPIVNKNKHIKTIGNKTCQKFIPVPVNNITKYNGTSVNKKFIPTNKHFDNGNTYFGI